MLHDGAELVRAGDHLGHGLDGPDLIVGEPDRDQRGTARDGIRVGAGILVDVCDLDGVALGFEAPDRPQDRLVLGRPRHDQPLLGDAATGAEDGEVDGLGA